MLLVALPEDTGEALAASGVFALTKAYGRMPIAVVCSSRVAPWFEEVPRRFWTLALGIADTEPHDFTSPRIDGRSDGRIDSKRLQVQWQLHRRLFPCALSGLVDMGSHMAITGLPSSWVLAGSRYYPRRVPRLWFRRQRGELIGEALERLQAQMLADTSRTRGKTPQEMEQETQQDEPSITEADSRPTPQRFGVAWEGGAERHDRRAAALLPGGNMRPWVIVAPALAQGKESGETPFTPEVCEQVCEALFFAGGLLPEGRVAILGAPGESGLATEVTAIFGTLLGSERVVNLVARTGLVLAGAIVARSTLVLSGNRTVAQVAAAARVPCLVLETRLEVEREAGVGVLPLWSGQESCSVPLDKTFLATKLRTLLVDSSGD